MADELRIGVFGQSQPFMPKYPLQYLKLSRIGKNDHTIEIKNNSFSHHNKGSLPFIVDKVKKAHYNEPGMKFAWVGDSHIGPYRTDYSIHRKGTIYTEKLLADFVHTMNTSFHPDFVVQGGDLIEDESKNVDIKNYKMGLAILSKLKCPVYHLAGNHELRKLTEKDLGKLLGYQKLYFSIDKGDWRLLFLFTKPGHPEENIILERAQLTWLKKQVTTGKRIVLFSHHSLVPVNTKGNFWFEKTPRATYIQNWRALLSIIKGKNVVLALNGHLHWTKKQMVNGVPFITIQSLVENQSRGFEGPPANSYALMRLSKNHALIDIKGIGEKKFSVRF